MLNRQPITMAIMGARTKWKAPRKRPVLAINQESEMA